MMQTGDDVDGVLTLFVEVLRAFSHCCHATAETRRASDLPAGDKCETAMKWPTLCE